MNRKNFSFKPAFLAAAVAGLLALPLAAQTSTGTTGNDNDNNSSATSSNPSATTTDTTTPKTDTNGMTGAPNGTLPRTASPLSLAALIGAGLFAGGPALRARRYRLS